MRSQHPHTKRGRTPRLLAAGLAVGTAVAAGVTALSAGPVIAAAAAAGPAVTPNAQVLAAQSADTLVAARPAFLHASTSDQFVRQQVISSNGAQYVPYLRTYSGLPVVGGDFVIATNSAGQVVFQSVAQDHPIGTLSTTPTLSSAKAASVASGQLKSVSKVEGTQLVVYALGSGPAALAWETTIDGVGDDGVSRLSVDVDAKTGKVLHTQEHVEHGSGTSAWNGPNPVHIDTSGSSGSYSMDTPNISNMPCQDAANDTTFTKSTDVWGSSDKTSRETGCVDALFGAQTEFKMLAQWDGRNGMDGSGGAWPIRVGDQEENAYYDGSQVQIGYNSQGDWIGAIDVIAHEMGHGVDDHTPGGISGNGTQEFVADTFGASTEWFANEPSPYDVPDFTVGEQINLEGSGPIRNMYNPSLINGDPNCYSSSIPGDEVHAAAGPGNHWFYLVAEGTNPTNGQPASPTCNNSTVTGVGVQNAEKIMYNAMLLKTSGASYLKYRVWTLQAAKTLDPTCAEFNTVKAAWTAVSVPAQSGEPTCTASTNDFSMAVSPTSGAVNPGSSLTATVSTTLTSGAAQSVALTASGLPAGATASFNPASVTSGSTSTLTLGTAATTPAGSYPVTITGTGTSATHTATFTLTVNGTGSETVSVSNPGNQTSTAGTAISTLQISATDSAGKSLTYSATGLPAGLSISTSGAITGTPTTAGSSSVTVTASSGTASGSTTFSWTVTPAGGGCTAAQLLGNPGFETGSAAPWTASAGVIDSSTSEPAHAGTWKAWMDGYGTTHTDTLSQQVSIPATCKAASFSFWLHVDTDETTTTTVFDTLKVQVLNSAGTVLGTLGTYSNLNAGSGYSQHSFSLASYLGQTITLKFTGAEDASLQTSFVVDDNALNVS